MFAKRIYPSRGDFALSSYRERERRRKGKVVRKEILVIHIYKYKNVDPHMSLQQQQQQKKKGIDSISHFVNRKKRKGGVFFFSGPKSGV